MNDPTRWIERDAPAGALELLRAAEPTRAAPSEVKARSAERVAGISLSTVSVTSAAGASFGFGAKLVGLAAVALVLGGLAWRAQTSSEHDEPRTRITRVPVAPHSPLRVEVPRVPIAPPRVEVQRAPVAPHSPHRVEISRAPVAPSRVESPPPPPPDDPLQQEIDALARVSSSLRHDPRAARQLLGDYRREHPRGRLTEERDFLAFEIARRLGARDEAIERASAFLHDYPHSSNTEAVRAWAREQ
jgi:hypothetical protein